MRRNYHDHHAQYALFCSICGGTAVQLLKSQGGYVCDDCAETSRLGSNTTTKALRVKQRANRAARNLASSTEDQVVARDELEYVKAAGELLSKDALATQVNCVRLAGGELAATCDENGVVFSADIVALEASNERVQLVSSLGNDIAALALDTAEAIGAVGSVEQLLAHQIAAAHHQAMTLLTRSNLEQDPVHQIKLSGLAAKWMSVTHSAILACKKLKANGEQRITIQHVNVSDGGQAVIGDVRAGGGK